MLQPNITGMKRFYLLSSNWFEHSHHKTLNVYRHHNGTISRMLIPNKLITKPWPNTYQVNQCFLTGYAFDGLAIFVLQLHSRNNRNEPITMYNYSHAQKRHNHLIWRSFSNLSLLSASPPIYIAEYGHGIMVATGSCFKTSDCEISQRHNRSTAII